MPVEISFLRHAIAAPRGSEGVSEEHRPLTEAGKRKMAQAARGMGKLGLRFDALLSSPLLRAVQTAEIVQRCLPFKGDLEIEESMRPGGDLSELLISLRGRKEKSFLLVGHEPTLSSWIRSLLGCARSSSLELKKGALCRLLLERAEPGARTELIALLPPKVLRGLDR